ncbi:hypothetical protein B0H13DRAFT_1943037 [Mycena leptocephala]|nr:hypothetical protein B0H13DRAFT_1943037 [Mycena leptocephala]
MSLARMTGTLFRSKFGPIPGSLNTPRIMIPLRDLAKLCSLCLSCFQFFSIQPVMEISLVGSRYTPRAAIDNFIQILHSMQLEEIQLPTPGVRAFLLPLTPGQLAQLANPKRITFYGAKLTIMSILPDSCEHSAKSFAVVHGRTAAFEHTLHRVLPPWTIIGPCEMGVSCLPGFNTFLSTRHDMLEFLGSHLGYSDRRELKVFLAHFLDILDMMALTLSSAFLDPNRDITVMEIDQMLRVESAQVTTLNSPK